MTGRGAATMLKVALERDTVCARALEHGELGTERVVAPARAVRPPSVGFDAERSVEAHLSWEAHPFLKWAGGKRRLVDVLCALLPIGVASMRHVEPFLGGGALFFARRPVHALLSDANADLMATYVCVRDELESVLANLAQLAAVHGEQTYYDARAAYNARRQRDASERAALFIYLNKTCFNGLHRVNRRGHFNVPMGRYAKPAIADEATLRAASARLRGVDLRCASFQEVLSLVRPGDFVYLDPPYAPSSATASFTQYTTGGFGAQQQLELRDVFEQLDARGAKLMLSNSDVPFTRDLYRGYRVDVVTCARALNCQGGGRGRVPELVIRNYG